MNNKRHLQAVKLVWFALTLGVAGGVARADGYGAALIPDGSFIRGDAVDHNGNGDAPTNSVYVSAFFLQTNLVSLNQWQSVYNWAINHGYTFGHAGTAPTGGNPVAGVSWYDAALWCNARSEMDAANGTTPCYYTNTPFGPTTVYRYGNFVLQTNNVNWAANGYRLPTEAEWEKAARAGHFGLRFPWGNTITHTQAWYTTGIVTPAYDTRLTNYPTSSVAVGTYPPNDFGLFDMAGNAEEWCWDGYSKTYYSPATTNNPMGPASGTTRVLRGGGWSLYADACRVANRSMGLPSTASAFIGFRCVVGNTATNIATAGTLAVSNLAAINIRLSYGMSLSNSFLAQAQTTGQLIITDGIGGTNVQGTLAFEYPATVPPVGTDSEYFIFYPADTTAFPAPLTSSVPVTVSANAPGRTTSDGQGLAFIPAGSFIRGDAVDHNGNGDAPTNSVYVSAFFMDTNLVSSGHWQKVYNWAIQNGYTFSHAGAAPATNRPVATISWYDAALWCNARSELESTSTNVITPCYYTNIPFSPTTMYRYGNFVLQTNNVNWAANGYRLPTEAEWEKAARAGHFGLRFPWGNTITHTQACYTTGIVTPAYDTRLTNYPTSSVAVGTYPPNDFGLFDMAGNAEEWCWDCYSSTYYSTNTANNPMGPASGATRVLRGGGWSLYADACRVANRSMGLPIVASAFIGFRCVAGNLTATNATAGTLQAIASPITNLFYGMSLSNSFLAQAQTTGQLIITDGIGGTNVPGTLAFEYPATVPPVGTDSEYFIFYPADTTAFPAPLTSSIPVTVSQTTPVLTPPNAITNLTTSQALDNSLLQGDGGTAINPYNSNPVVGTWSFTTASGQTLTAGDHPNVSVTFTTTNPGYTNAYTTVDVQVAQAPDATNLYVVLPPTAGPIYFGQTLADSPVTGGYLVDSNTNNVTSGIWAFTQSSQMPGVGTNVWELVFHPSGNYLAATTSVTVAVYQTTPGLTPPNQILITNTQTLDNSLLQGGNGGTATNQFNSATVLGTWTFTTADGKTFAAGTSNNVSVTFTPTAFTNYTTATTTVAVIVQSTNTTTIALNGTLTATNHYGQAVSNAVVTGGYTNSTGNNVPGSFTFSNPTNLLHAGIYTNWQVTFTESNAPFTSLTSSVPVTVLPTTPTLVPPKAGAITTSEVLDTSVLTGGTATNSYNHAPVIGIWTFANSGQTLTAGTHTNVSVTFTPADALDYATTTNNVSVTVSTGPANPSNYHLSGSLTATINYGERLSDWPPNWPSVYEGQTSNTKVNGTFAFLNPNYVPPTGTELVSVAFTPTNKPKGLSIYAFTNTLNVTVNKTTPLLTPPVATTITRGQTLAASSLSGGTAVNRYYNNIQIAGTFAFSNPSLVLTNTKLELVTFTPADTTDYSTATTTVSVTVNPAGPKSTNSTNHTEPGTPPASSLVNPTTLAAFLGTNQLDLNELRYILTNNYAHPAVVTPNLLADFIGTTNLNFVDANDMAVFLNYYPLGNTVSSDTLAKVLGTPGNVQDQTGLNALLAQYITWPGAPSFTNLPPYLAASGGGAGQTNYCFTITNFNFTVQFSPDLVHWTNLDLPGQIQFTDPQAPAKPGGFYRLLNSTGN